MEGIRKKLEPSHGESTKLTAEGCINCEFIEYRNGIGNYCSEHERYVADSDSPCKNYVEQGCY